MSELDPIWIDWPHVRIPRELDTEQSTVTRFVVQLEYNIATVSPAYSDPEWRVVARFDHDTTSEGGHDITEEGLHLDIYRDGDRYERARGFPILSVGEAMRYAEEYLHEHRDQLLTRFEQWHDLDGPWSRH